MSADLGCYGDAYSRSPTIDRLAAEGVRYTRCFTHIGVCAPSRSGLITAMYPPSIGSQHMRSQTVLPPYVKCYSELPSRRRLLLHEQQQDRLQLQRSQDRLGRKQRQGPLEEPTEGQTVLRDLQSHDHAREPDSRAAKGVSNETPRD